MKWSRDSCSSVRCSGFMPFMWTNSGSITSRRSRCGIPYTLHATSPFACTCATPRIRSWLKLAGEHRWGLYASGRLPLHIVQEGWYCTSSP